MDGHCSCCDGYQKIAADLKEQNKVLQEKAENLESENGRLDRRNDELHEEVSDAEELVEKAERAQDKLYQDLREEKRKELAMLRRLEFSLHGLCPLCLGILDHKTGCDLKLAIFRVDHELNRTEYVHL